MARNALRTVPAAQMVLVALLLTSCTTPEIIRETPQPNPTATQTLVPVETTPEPTATAVVDDSQATVERIAFATRVSDDGTPVDERSVIPEEAEIFYLCVQVREVQQGSRFQAIWFEEGEIIGRSEKLALEDSTDPVWMAMQYRPIGKLNPALDHAVELLIDDDTVERLAFRVGVGNAADAVAAAAFTTGFDLLGKAISPQTRFNVDTPQLTLRVRISNQVDPTGMIFTTLWFRGDTQIAQRAPDESGEDPRRLTFTLVPSSKLPPGDYRVSLLLNGTEVRSIPFVMTAEAVPTPEPAPTARPNQPTATSSVPGSGAIGVVVASRINDRTQAPLDGPYMEWSGPPGGVASLWVAVAVRDIQASDTIGIVVHQNDAFYGSVTLETDNIDSGWLASRVELETPTDTTSFTYTIIVNVNDERALETTIDVRAR